jgi:hypothetical protein
VPSRGATYRRLPDEKIYRGIHHAGYQALVPLLMR